MNTRILILVFLLFSMFQNSLVSQSIKEYFITCDPDEFEYINENKYEDIYIPITIEYAGKIKTDVRMRIRGDGTREFDKRSLKVKFDSEPFANHRKTLNFNAEYQDRSYIHQFLSSRLFIESGQFCFLTEYARLYINDKFHGLFLMIENVDDDFLEARGLSTKNNLYKATKDGASMTINDYKWDPWEKKTNANSDMSDLNQLIEEMYAVSDNDFYDYAKKHFVYDKMVNIIAMNILIGNGSTYYHNYYMYHFMDEDLWQMFPWDLDKTMNTYGSFRQYFWWYENPFFEKSILNKRILSDIRYRIDELAATIFNSEHLNPIIDSLVTILSSSVEEDTADDIKNMDDWKLVIEDDKKNIEIRYDNLIDQFENFPSCFRVEKTPDTFTDEITFKWHPSTDPRGKEITYDLIFFKGKYFVDSLKTAIYGIKDTTYTLKNPVDEGVHCWVVYATNGEYALNGYPAYDRFYFKEASILPCEIKGDMVLTKDDSPYLAECDITIPEGSSLLIGPGAELRCRDSINIYAHGRFDMIGNEYESARLRSDLNTVNWNILHIDGTQYPYTFDHAKIEDFRIIANGSDLTMKNSEFLYSKEFKNIMIEAYSGKFRFSDNRVIGNGISDGMNVFYSDGAIVENSYFEYISDPIELLKLNNGIIRNNVINRSGDDAIDLNGCNNVFITGNKIFNSADKGISIANFAALGSKNVRIEKNLIVGNSIGIAVKHGSNAFVNNNTIHDNNYGLYSYEMDPGLGGGVIEAKNNIITDSHNEALFVDSLSEAIVSYTLCDSELLEGTGNIHADPKYLSPKQNDYSLMSDSPCIDAGDPNSPTDPDGSRADMGAFYFNKSNKEIVINEINYHSADDFDPEDWVELYNPNSDTVDISNWQLKDGEDSHYFQFKSGTYLAPDAYVVICKDTIAFSGLFPGVRNRTGNMGFGLSADGESVRLFNADGILIDEVKYNDKLPWAEEPDGNGPTLELIYPKYDNALAENWAASDGHGTPGGKNSRNDSSIKNKDIQDDLSMQIYPNPSVNQANIEFDVSLLKTISLKIYDALGNEVSSIFDLSLAVGYQKIIYDTSNLASGIYFVKLSTPTSNTQENLVIMR